MSQSLRIGTFNIRFDSSPQYPLNPASVPQREGPAQAQAVLSGRSLSISYHSSCLQSAYQCLFWLQILNWITARIPSLARQNSHGTSDAQRSLTKCSSTA